MIALQSGQIAIRFPSVSVTGLYSTTGRRLRCAASDAIEFTRLTRPLVFNPTCLKEGSKVSPEYQKGSRLIAGRESMLDPLPHGVPVNAEQTGDLFHCVVAMDFYESII
jgi:hypothetical protein